MQGIDANNPAFGPNGCHPGGVIAPNGLCYDPPTSNSGGNVAFGPNGCHPGGVIGPDGLCYDPPTASGGPGN